MILADKLLRGASPQRVTEQPELPEPWFQKLYFIKERYCIMAEARPREEKIAALEKEIEAKKAQIQRLKNLEKEKERKARTKRLIEIGKAVENALGGLVEKEDLPALKVLLVELLENAEHKENKNQTD